MHSHASGQGPSREKLWQEVGGYGNGMRRLAADPAAPDRRRGRLPTLVSRAYAFDGRIAPRMPHYAGSEINRREAGQAVARNAVAIRALAAGDAPRAGLGATAARMADLLAQDSDADGWDRRPTAVQSDMLFARLVHSVALGRDVDAGVWGRYPTFSKGGRWYEAVGLAADVCAVLRSDERELQALRPFLFLEPYLPAAVLAAAETAAIHPARPDDPLAGFRAIRDALADIDDGDDERPGAFVAGLLALGDARALGVAGPVWRSPSEGAKTTLAHLLSGVVCLAQVEFALRWAEEADDAEFGFAGRMLARFPRDSASFPVARDLHWWLPAPHPGAGGAARPITIVQEWRMPELARIIEPRLRLRQLAETTEPLLTPFLLRAWGIEPGKDDETAHLQAIADVYRDVEHALSDWANRRGRGRLADARAIAREHLDPNEPLAGLASLLRSLAAREADPSWVALPPLPDADQPDPVRASLRRRVRQAVGPNFTQVLHALALVERASGDLDLSSRTPRMYRGASLAGIEFSGQDLTGVDFAGADLTGCTFRETVLEGANFFGATLHNAVFTEANASRATFIAAKAAGAVFTGADLSEASFDRAELHRADFTDANLDEAIFEDADLSDAILRPDSWSNATFLRARAPRLDIGDCLISTLHQAADLTGADFTMVADRDARTGTYSLRNARFGPLLEAGARVGAIVPAGSPCPSCKHFVWVLDGNDDACSSCDGTGWVPWDVEAERRSRTISCPWCRGYGAYSTMMCIWGCGVCDGLGVTDEGAFNMSTARGRADDDAWEANLMHVAAEAPADAEDLDFSGIAEPWFELLPGTYTRCSFAGSSFEQATFCGSTLVDCDFSGANLENADLSSSRFERCDFRSASIEAADVSGTEFVDCLFGGHLKVTEQPNGRRARLVPEGDGS